MTNSHESTIAQALGKAFDAYAVTLETMKARNIPLALPSQYEPLHSALEELARTLLLSGRQGK